jgi:uncharacterized protein (TIGR02118 family)
MHKLIFAITFKGDKQQGFEHWSARHSKLLLDIPGVVKYVQNEKVLDLGGDRFDGVAELYFEDEAAYEAAMASSYWNDVVQPDGDSFVDWELTGGAIVREHRLR